MTGLGTATTAVLSNTTSPGSPLAVGDNWKLQIAGSPNRDVYATGTFPSGATFHTKFGVTDSEGNFTDEGTEAQEHLGHWDIVWSVGDEAAPVMSFDVAATREVSGKETVGIDSSISIPTWAWIAGAAAVAWFAFLRKK